jgi:hypothetical protein
MRSKIRCDRKYRKILQNFLQLNRAQEQMDTAWCRRVLIPWSVSSGRCKCFTRRQAGRQVGEVVGGAVRSAGAISTGASAGGRKCSHSDASSVLHAGAGSLGQLVVPRSSHTTRSCSISYCCCSGFWWWSTHGNRVRLGRTKGSSWLLPTLLVLRALVLENVVADRSTRSMRVRLRCLEAENIYEYLLTIKERIIICKGNVYFQHSTWTSDWSLRPVSVSISCYCFQYI